MNLDKNHLKKEILELFPKEKDFDNYCKEKSQVTHLEDVDWDNVIGYWVPMALGLPTYNKDVEDILSILLSSYPPEDCIWPPKKKKKKK